MPADSGTAHEERPRGPRIFIFSLAIIALGALVYALFDRGLIRFNYPSPIRFPVRGIDVSHHQGVIDWKAVASDKTIRFAYIKATEGGDFKDRNFSENWKKSAEAGIIRGAYHFFTFCRPGRDQARNFLETVPWESDALPMAVDLEFGGNCDARPSLETLLAELTGFLSEIRKVHPQRPVFYVTPGFFNQYLKGNIPQFPDHDLWLRNIFYEPLQKPCAHWQFWQFADRDRIAGIGGPVDLNVFCGDQAMLYRLIERR